MGFGGSGWGVDPGRVGVELLGGGRGRPRGAGHGGPEPSGDAGRACRRPTSTLTVDADVGQGADGRGHERVAGGEEGRAPRSTGCGRYLRPSGRPPAAAAGGERRRDDVGLGQPAPGGVYAPGQVLHLRFQVAGTGFGGAVGQGVVRTRRRSPRSWQVQAVGLDGGAPAARRCRRPRLPVELGHQRSGHPHRRQPPGHHPGAGTAAQRRSVAAFVATPTDLTVERRRFGVRRSRRLDHHLRVGLRRRQRPRRDAPRRRRTPTRRPAPTR